MLQVSAAEGRAGKEGASCSRDLHGRLLTTTESVELTTTESVPLTTIESLTTTELLTTTESVELTTDHGILSISSWMIIDNGQLQDHINNFFHETQTNLVSGTMETIFY